MEKEDIKIIPKIFTREFPLILCQIWGDVFKSFFGVEITSYPIQVLVIKNGIVEAYRNPDASKEINNIFLKQAQRDEDFFKNFYNEFLNKFTELEKLWAKDFLTKEELEDFYEKMTDFWPAIYASMFIPRDERFLEGDRELLVSLRKKIDVAADEASRIIFNTINHFYNAGELACYFSMKDFLEGVSQEELEKKSREGMYILNDKIIDFQKLEELQKEYNFVLEGLEQENIKDKEVLQGQTASPGYAKGKARLLFKRAEVGSFKEGEVLVSPMTVPDFLPAMKKARAFVTDEGGITCHAAIVARELKKPCVIGTKIATKVLKDGDLVEVDADKGIVRKL